MCGDCGFSAMSVRVAQERCSSLATFEGPQQSTSLAFDASQTDFALQATRPYRAGTVVWQGSLFSQLRPAQTSRVLREFFLDGVAKIYVSHGCLFRNRGWLGIPPICHTPPPVSSFSSPAAHRSCPCYSNPRRSKQSKVLQWHPSGYGDPPHQSRGLPDLCR